MSFSSYIPASNLGLNSSTIGRRLCICRVNLCCSGVNPANRFSPNSASVNGLPNLNAISSSVSTLPVPKPCWKANALCLSAAYHQGGSFSAGILPVALNTLAYSGNCSILSNSFNIKSISVTAPPNILSA